MMDKTREIQFHLDGFSPNEYSVSSVHYLSDLTTYPVRRHVFPLAVYVCMYLLIGKGQSALKRPFWGEDRIKRKFMIKHMSLVVV